MPLPLNSMERKNPMKRSTVFPIAFAMLVATLTLMGCTNKRIAEVKALPFSYPSDLFQDPNMTVDQALDYRHVCDSVKWTIDQTEQHQNFVQYECIYKGFTPAKESIAQVAKIPGAGYRNQIGDIYQWVYGADGQPTLTYVAIRSYYSNGTTKDRSYSGYDNTVSSFMQLAVQNRAQNYLDMTGTSFFQ